MSVEDRSEPGVGPPEAWLAGVALHATRYAAMTAGVRRFEAWMDDLLAFGLATLEADPSTARSSVTIGATLLDGRDVDLSALIAEADQTLIDAKRTAKNTVAWAHS